AEITLKAGGNYIKIDPSGVTIVTPGASSPPGSGAGWAGLLPVQLANGDDTVAQLPVIDLYRQIATLRSAAPVCEICESQSGGEV
ncbi:DUF2345 domain-containing protein, partial [Aeromonas veronii]|nr:DUF2345 domain-containing protein [Aeromonas veronii]